MMELFICLILILIKKDAADENFVVENLSNYEVSNIQQLTKIIRDTFKSD